MTPVEERLADLLRIAAGNPPANVTAEDVHRYTRRRRTRTVAAVAALAALTAAVVVPLVMLSSGPQSLTIGNRPASGPLFGGNAPGTSREPAFSAQPGANPVFADAAAAIRDERYSSSLSVDGGALTITPTQQQPSVSERNAIALFRTTGGTGFEIMTSVVVGFGAVTLADPAVLPPDPLRAGLSGPSPRVAPRQPAWVIFYGWGPHSCPAMGATTRQGPPEYEPARAVLVFGANQAVAYTGRGSLCGETPSGPSARIAEQTASVPWRLRTDATGHNQFAFTVPGCGRETGAELGGHSATGPLPSAIYVGEPLWPLHCPKAMSQTMPDSYGTSLVHAPTGPLTNIATGFSPVSFTYYDGSSTSAAVAEQLCRKALGDKVIAASLTTVGDARTWTQGGPYPPPTPAQSAFPGHAASEPAAWCTTGGNGTYMFYVAGPDGSAVRLEGVGGWSGPTPSAPVPIP